MNNLILESQTQVNDLISEHLKKNKEKDKTFSLILVRAVPTFRMQISRARTRIKSGLLTYDARLLGSRRINDISYREIEIAFYMAENSKSNKGLSKTWESLSDHIVESTPKIDSESIISTFFGGK